MFKKSLALLTFILPLATSLAQEEIFLSTLGGDLYSLNLEDCSYDFLGEMPVSSTDISFHPNGDLYAITSGGTLFRVDVITGTATEIYTFVGSNQVFTALTISATGDFYACGLDGDLFRYNLAAASGAFLGNVGTGAEGDLTFYQGELYMAGTDDRIIQVNVQSPLNSSVAINGNVPGRIFGIVSYAASCDSISVYALTDQAATVFEVDLENNLLTEYCSIPLQVSGGASTFEFLGSNPITIQPPVANGFDCDAATGEVDIQASGGIGGLQYSLDGINYQNDATFSNLAIDDYIIYVADENGCVSTIPFSPLGGPLRLISSETEDTSCGAANGSWTNEVAGGASPYVFTLNDSLQLAAGNFYDLPAGVYDLEVTSANGCSIGTSTTIAASQLFELFVEEIIPASCGEANGILRFDGRNGSEPYEVTFDGQQLEDAEEIFVLLEQLSAGPHSMTFVDLRSCSATLYFEVPGSPALDVSLLGTTAADCNQDNGSASFAVSGGSGNIRLFSPIAQLAFSGTLNDLAPGNRTLTFVDELGCQDTVSFDITTSRCPVYVPNAFSPNLDGVNDFFGPLSVSNSGITILRFQVFDRWGGLLFERLDGDIEDPVFRWDGLHQGKVIGNGSYLYQIELAYGNGETEILAGSVELLR